MAAAVAAFFLRRIPVECLAEEEVLGSEYLLVAEWTQAEPIPPRRLEAVGAEGQLEAPRAVERPQLL